MSADRLRAAAAVLRERAEAATGEYGWRLSSSNRQEVWAPRDPADYNAQMVATTSTRLNRNNSETAMSNAAYIAIMSPPVALAVAEWLADVANWVDYGNTTAGDLRHAHAVADTILGPN